MYTDYPREPGEENDLFNAVLYWAVIHTLQAHQRQRPNEAERRAERNARKTRERHARARARTENVAELARIKERQP